MYKKLLLAAFVICCTVSCRKDSLVPDWSIFNPHIHPPVAPVDLNIPGDSIKLNPYGFTPLSALIKFRSAVMGKAVLIVKGKHGAATDVEHVFDDYGFSHSIPVIGLYPNFLNTVTIKLVNNNRDTVAKTTINIQTGVLPAGLPTLIQPDVLPNDRAEEGLTLISNLSVDNPQIPYMVDNYGVIRWVLDYSTHPSLTNLSYDNGIRRLRNGNFYFGNASTNMIYEVDLLGKIINTWNLNATEYMFHHDIYEKPDGNLVTTVTKKGSTNTKGLPTYEDYIIEINRQTGNINNSWDLKESLDEYRTALNADIGDWIHVNSILFDSSDHTIIVSGRHQGVIKLTYDNRVKWIISVHKGWGVNRRGEDLNQFLLLPLAADGSRITDTEVLNGTINHNDFEWCWYQHSPIELPNSNLMIFDNGTTRNYIDEGNKYSRVVEYKIDEVNMTIQQKWEYGKERGVETYSSVVSSVQFLPKTNHVLFAPGFFVKNHTGSGGKIVEVDYFTKEVVSQLSISAASNRGFHRAKRLSAYPD